MAAAAVAAVAAVEGVVSCTVLRLKEAKSRAIERRRRLAHGAVST